METIITDSKFSRLINSRLIHLITVHCILIFPAFSVYAVDDIDHRGLYTGASMGYGNIKGNLH
jgi:hypothetical protein